MTALTPARFKRQVAETRERILAELADLPELYERAYYASHSQAGRGQGGKISRGGHSDPTLQVLGDPLDKNRSGAQAKIRRTLERAPKTLATIESDVIAIERLISKAMDKLDPPPGFEALRFPVSASQADLEESRAAQKRRRERGEDIG